MTRPVPRRHTFDPADSDFFERQEAALSMWAEKLQGKQWLFLEREQIFDMTRLALGGPRRCQGPPPAASPASEHSPRRVGVTCQALAALSLAAPLLARPPITSPAYHRPLLKTLSLLNLVISPTQSPFHPSVNLFLLAGQLRDCLPFHLFHFLR